MPCGGAGRRAMGVRAREVIGPWESLLGTPRRFPGRRWRRPGVRPPPLPVLGWAQPPWPLGQQKRRSREGSKDKVRSAKRGKGKGNRSQPAGCRHEGCHPGGRSGDLEFGPRVRTWNASHSVVFRGVCAEQAESHLRSPGDGFEDSVGDDAWRSAGQRRRTALRARRTAIPRASGVGPSGQRRSRGTRPAACASEGTTSPPSHT